MILNKKNLKYISLIFCLITLVLIVISTVNVFNVFLNEYNETFGSASFLTTMGLILISILVAIIKNIFMVCIILAIKLSSRKYYKKRLDETDFNKNKNYYRDIIKNYSASVLNYIDNFKLDYKQSYTAKLLELQKNGFIKINDGVISITNQPTLLVDKEFVESIKNNKITMPISKYESYVIDEAISKGLLEKCNKNDVLKYIALLFGAPMIYTLVFFISVYLLITNEFFLKYVVVIIIGIIILTVLMVFLCAFSIAYITKSSIEKLYKRTSKGKKINEQLDGLKLFMDEFGDMQSKEAKHIVLWEDYLIYSVIFNINKKIQNEYSKYFD